MLSNPDKPYLVWSYTNGRGEVIERDNPTDFVAAAEAMCVAMQRFRVGAEAAKVPGMSREDRGVFAELIRGTRDPDGEVRHRVWQGAIADGAFSFGPASPSYVAKGVGSWKHAALGTTAEHDGDEEFPYTPEFMRSDWKLFHDALQEHRYVVLHHILPRYGQRPRERASLAQQRVQLAVRGQLQRCLAAAEQAGPGGSAQAEMVAFAAQHRRLAQRQHRLRVQLVDS